MLVGWTMFQCYPYNRPSELRTRKEDEEKEKEHEEEEEEEEWGEREDKHFVQLHKYERALLVGAVHETGCTSLSVAASVVVEVAALSNRRVLYSRACNEDKMQTEKAATPIKRNVLSSSRSCIMLYPTFPLQSISYEYPGIKRAATRDDDDDDVDGGGGGDSRRVMDVQRLRLTVREERVDHYAPVFINDDNWISGFVGRDVNRLESSSTLNEELKSTEEEAKGKKSNLKERRKRRSQKRNAIEKLGRLQRWEIFRLLSVRLFFSLLSWLIDSSLEGWSLDTARSLMKLWKLAVSQQLTGYGQQKRVDLKSFKRQQKKKSETPENK